MPTVTFTIADEDYAAFLVAFLAFHPVPVDPGTGAPTMSDNEWVKERGRQFYWDAYRQGLKRQRDRDHPVNPDPDILT